MSEENRCGDEGGNEELAFPPSLARRPCWRPANGDGERALFLRVGNGLGSTGEDYLYILSAIRN